MIPTAFAAFLFALCDSPAGSRPQSAEGSFALCDSRAGSRPQSAEGSFALCDSPEGSRAAGHGGVAAMDAKRELRARALQMRKAAFDLHGPEAGRKLAAHGLDFLNIKPGMSVSGFAAIRDEINPADLMLWLHAEGVRLALPVMQGKGLPLLMRTWSPGDAMQAVEWGIAEPLDDKPAIIPDIVLVPLLAFDARGYRIGYGGGFYDRTLAKLRAKKPILAVGLAYDEQKVDAVPHDGYDQRVDWVLTPSGPIRCDMN